jgi:hypothetical protein
VLPFVHVPPDDLEGFLFGPLSAVFQSQIPDFIGKKKGGLGRFFRFDLIGKRGFPGIDPVEHIQKDGHRMLAPFSRIWAVAGGIEAVGQKLDPGGIVAVVAVHVVNKGAPLQVGLGAGEGAILIELYPPLKDDIGKRHVFSDIIPSQLEHVGSLLCAVKLEIGDCKRVTPLADETRRQSPRVQP